MSDEAQARQLIGREVAVNGRFSSSDGDTATDLSGIASAAPLSKRRRKCLVIDNKDVSAQFATLDLDKLTLEPRRKVRLLPKRAGNIKAVGTPPDKGKPGKQYAFDGEAVTWLHPHYYLTGSHSLRDLKKDKESSGYRRSAHLIARVDKSGTGTELSFRLNKLLRDHRQFADGFLKRPDEESGVNIEGLAAWGRRLYFGFRSPVPDPGALLLSVRAEALFAPRAHLSPRTAHVPLGEGLGIRSLCFLPDGRLLVLAGPKDDAETDFSVNLCRRDGTGLELLGTLAWSDRKRAEGMLLAEYVTIPDGRAIATILIVHDHPRNGQPRLYDLEIPPP